jgi:hypothetical protein
MEPLAVKVGYAGLGTFFQAENQPLTLNDDG